MISLKAMSVGDGYKYLTGHVARGDVDQAAREGGTTPLTRYYAASGYPPGRWMGAGLAGLGEELAPGTEVEEWRMACLFAEGRDPTTGQPLGRQPKVYASLAERIATKTAELPNTLVDADRDAAIDQIRRSENRRVTRTAKGGFDLTFTVPKSVSALWAIADDATQQTIVAAHHDTLTDIVDYLEREVIFTRVGKAGVAQVDTRGVIAAAFDHWDSRSQDPNLHTHLAVANRVQTLEGTWLTIDSRGLHHAIVAVSELYDSMLADRLTRELGVGWEPRERATRRTVAHEISGISEALIAEFSARARQVDEHTATLIEAFVAKHGRHPDDDETHDLHNIAKLMNRPAKHAPVPLEVLTGQWRVRAERATGRAPADIVADTIDRHTGYLLLADQIDPESIDAWAHLAVGAIQARRSTWNRWNLITEAARLTQGDLRFATSTDRETFIHRIVDVAQEISVALHPHATPMPAERFRRRDGADVFTQHAARRYTSSAILGAEAYLLSRGSDPSGPTANAQVDGKHSAGLADDQLAAVERIATSGRSIEVLIGPAGTGKTTTLAALRDRWETTHGPGSVIGLAPSASAAEVLGGALGVECENTAKWLHESSGSGSDHRDDARRRVHAALKRSRGPRARARLTDALVQIDDRTERWTMQSGQLVIVDEASLAGTLSLAALAHQAELAGAKLLLVGDHAQLSAVDAGGALGMLAASPDAVELSSVWRFNNDWERSASLRLRDGDTRIISTYLDHRRVHEGTHADMLDTAYAHWLADTRDGLTSLLIAADNTTVAALNRRARDDLVAIGTVEAGGAALNDGSLAGIGDRIVTRRNNRAMRDLTGWVRNGDTFTVIARTKGGALTVRRENGRDATGDVLTLPDWYVAKHVGLAYATTAHRAQGATVDTAHAAVTTSLSREVLYVAMTRGRDSNNAYVALDDPSEDPADAHHTEHPATGQAVLEAVLQRSDAERSATQTADSAHQQSQSMATLIPLYEHIAQQLSEIRWAPEIHRLTDTTPEVAEQVLASDAWPKLTALLRNVTLSGLDTTAILAGAWNGQDLTDSDDPAAVLLGRVASTFNSTVPKVQPIRYLAGIVVPGEPANDPALQRTLDHAAHAITQRASSLARRALDDVAPWTVALGDRPEDPVGAHAWDTAVLAAAAYRDRWGVTDDRPLGDTGGPDRSQHRDRSRARRAIDSLAAGTPPREPDRTTESASLTAQHTTAHR